MTLSNIVQEFKPAVAAYLKAARQIEAGNLKGLKSVNLAVLSTFTAEQLRPYILVESAARGLLVKSYFAPFNQLEQQVLDKNSSLYKSEPDTVVIAARLEDIAPDLIYRFISLSSDDIENELSAIETRLQNLIEGLRNFTQANVLVFNFAGPLFLTAGLADPALKPSQSSVVQNANERLADISRKSTGVFVFDYARQVSEYGLQRWYDRKLLYLGRIPFGADAQRKIGQYMARMLRAINFPPAKCLVLDLDNTLWGGTVGEDGLEGIALGEDHPGNIYKDFQRFVLALRDRGVLLAIASKNNQQDALEVFQKHPDCVLRLEDFAAVQINWNDKASNLTAIAKELNIGTDALAFFDNDPVERDWIRTQMPEVSVIEVPESPLGYIDSLIESGSFDQLTISDEDRFRSELYQGNQKRQQLRSQAVSLDEFLKQLDMTVRIGCINSVTLPRASQLVAKTNQFNLTTRRHSSSDIEALINDGAVALWLRVSDRFGDNGLVGVAIGLPLKLEEWKIDTFLLSCRVIGRQVESAFLAVLSRFIRERGGKILWGEYLATDKNSFAADFYRTHDFESVDNDGRFWRRNLLANEILIPEFMKVVVEDGTRN